MWALVESLQARKSIWTEKIIISDQVYVVLLCETTLLNIYEYKRRGVAKGWPDDKGEGGSG